MLPGSATAMARWSTGSRTGRYGIPGDVKGLPEGGGDLDPGLDRRALVDRIEDHVIEQARLVGTYTNKG